MIEQNHTLLYSFDAGNGSCRAKSSEAHDVIQFEPVIAPITDRHGIRPDDERPTFSRDCQGFCVNSSELNAVVEINNQLVQDFRPMRNGHGPLGGNIPMR